MSKTWTKTFCLDEDYSGNFPKLLVNFKMRLETHFRQMDFMGSKFGFQSLRQNTDLNEKHRFQIILINMNVSF